MKAKGISEKAILEKTAAERPAGERHRQAGGDRRIPAETRRHQSAPREKTAAKTAPAPAPVVSAPAQPAAAPSSRRLRPPVHPEERRDANDLARAAIERLRGSNDGSPRPQEAARTPDAARVPDAARIPDAPRVVMAPAVRPLPPPIMVSTPARETFDSTAGSESEAALCRCGTDRRSPPPDAAGRHPVTPRSICGPRHRNPPKARGR